MTGDHVLTEVAFCKELAVPMTETLKSIGAGLNATDAAGDSFLSCAVSRDNHELNAYPIDHGAAMETGDSTLLTGCTTVHSVRSLAMLKYLRQHRIEVASRCTNGRTLLHYAARSGATDIIAFVLTGKLIDPTLTDNEGLTARDYADRANATDAGQLLP